jgi:hypothetical protein
MEKEITLTQEELISVLRNLSMKCEFANSQILNLGLIVEYYAQILEEAGIDLKLGDFEGWAQKRHEEIKKFAESDLAEKLTADIAEQFSNISDINLTE